MRPKTNEDQGKIMVTKEMEEEEKVEEEEEEDEAGGI